MLDNLTMTPSAWHSPLAERYRMGQLLGSGAMAEVRRAEDTRLRRPVAIKLFRADPDPLAQRRFGAEAQVLAQLSHPGLVSIYDAGIDGSRPFLVMQLIEGESLRSRLARGPLAPAEVIRIGVGLAEAMSHVHGRGVVHRDVKPGNILLDDEDQPYLADFGIARLSGATRLTCTGELVGTACYLAPEQLRDSGVAAPIDVYALGLVLLECLSGELVYPGDNQLQSALSRLHRTPEVPAGVPAPLGALLTAMTSADPRRRPTAQQCADTLRAWDRNPSPARPPELLNPPERDLMADLADTPSPRVSAETLPPVSAESLEATGAFTVAPVDLAADPLATACRTATRSTRRALRHLGRTAVPRRRGGPYLAGAAALTATVAGVAFLIGAHGDQTNQPVSHPLAPAPAATAALGAAPGAQPPPSTAVAVQPLANTPAVIAKTAKGKTKDHQAKSHH